MSQEPGRFHNTVISETACNRELHTRGSKYANWCLRNPVGSITRLYLRPRVIGNCTQGAQNMPWRDPRTTRGRVTNFFGDSWQPRRRIWPALGSQSPCCAWLICCVAARLAGRPDTARGKLGDSLGDQPCAVRSHAKHGVCFLRRRPGPQQRRGEERAAGAPPASLRRGPRAL